MKKGVRLNLIFILVFVIGLVNMSMAQQSYNLSSIKIKVEGTSNIHDWHMMSEQGQCNAMFNWNGSVLNGLSSLSFSMPAESLKSDSKVMDKNTYKALVTDKYPTISFNVITSNVKPGNNNTYVVSVKGKMTISSVSKEVWLAGVATLNADKTVSVYGSYKFKMTEYNVTPPSIMFGSIVVGDELVIKFNLLFKPQ